MLLGPEDKTVNTPLAATGHHQVDRHPQQGQGKLDTVAASGDTVGIHKETMGPVDLVNGHRHHRSDTGC
ncbi:hypothetical protein SDC9_202823 [bioreactor metagenome]|uniref:Uncharacterized protein n=1 Tax=bioreactor metagenome TaxID=1076179 RepID=A0A645J3S4_9ZZZZ